MADLHTIPTPVPLRLAKYQGYFLHGLLETRRAGATTELEEALGYHERAAAERDRAALGRLIKAVEDRAIVPDHEVLRVVRSLAEAVDRHNDFERVQLEHRSLCSLLDQIEGGVRATAD